MPGRRAAALGLSHAPPRHAKRHAPRYHACTPQQCWTLSSWPAAHSQPYSQPRPPLSSAARPVAHAVLSTGLARDRLDVTQASLTKELAALPAEGAARDAARASIARLQAERWQKERASSSS